MKKNCKSVLLLVSLLGLLFYSLFHTSFIVKEILFYTELFIRKVFPTSFIFLLLSYLLMDYHIFSYLEPYIPDKGLYFLLMAMISGYPTGSIFVKDALEGGEITIEEADEIIQYAHFPNPLFVIYQVGIIMQKRISYIFYFIIFMSNFFIYLFSKHHKKDKTFRNIVTPNFSHSLSNSLLKVFKVLILIYGTSIFFYLISCIIRGYFSSYLYVFFSGLFDLTNGVVSVRILSDSFIQGIYLFFFIVFGSLSIHLQIKSILSDTLISYSSFVKGRILSFLLCILLWVIYTSCAMFIC